MRWCKVLFASNSFQLNNLISTEWSISARILLLIIPSKDLTCLQSSWHWHCLNCLSLRYSFELAFTFHFQLLFLSPNGGKKYNRFISEHKEISNRIQSVYISTTNSSIHPTYHIQIYHHNDRYNVCVYSRQIFK